MATRKIIFSFSITVLYSYKTLQLICVAFGFAVEIVLLVVIKPFKQKFDNYFYGLINVSVIGIVYVVGQFELDEHVKEVNQDKRYTNAVLGLICFVIVVTLVNFIYKVLIKIFKKDDDDLGDQLGDDGEAPQSLA